MGLPPQAINIAQSSHGKLYLPAPWDRTKLRFNVSHSGDVMVFAIACDYDIGVDVERIDVSVNVEAAAPLVLQTRDLTLFRGFSLEQKTAIFFACWTRLEAAVKADGHGLLLESADIDMPPAMTENESCGIRDCLVSGKRWVLTDLRVHPDYAAALATDRYPRMIRYIGLEGRDGQGRSARR